MNQNKKRNQLISMCVVMLAVFTFAGCDDNEEIIVADPTGTDYDVELVFSEGNTASESINVDPALRDAISTRLAVTSTDLTMRRLYITVDVQGQGEEPFDLTTTGLNIDDKGDGSLDIESTGGQSIEYEFDLPVPDTISEGTVVFKFWTTSGKGDFRDVEKRLVAGAGTITMNYGGTDPATELNSYSDVRLDAPRGDGKSDTFIYLATGEIFQIEDDEFTAFWDFGYYYLNTTLAHFASPYGYRMDVVDIPTEANTTQDELNHCYFAFSSVTSDDFDGYSTAGDLDFITASTEEDLGNIEVGDIIEFVDNYGKKGLIRVTFIEPGFNADDYIVFDIKVQP